MEFFKEGNNNNRKAENSLWCEKYRPDGLENYIGNDHLKSSVETYIETNDIPHLLFHGKPGTGKTTLAKIIVNNIDCDYIIINASDENGIETVRTKIKNFASTVGFRSKKIIILDEADYLTPNGQASLRNVMETFSEHTRFILTCNYPEKIIPAIQSRCQTFQIVPPTKKDVAIHVSKLLEKEGVSHNPKDLVPIMDKMYPDIRKIINTCQLNSTKGELKVDKKTVMDSDTKAKVVEILNSKDSKKNKYNKIRKLIANASVQDFTDFYNYLYEKVDEYGEGNTSAIILILAEHQYKDAMVVDKEITYMSCMIGIINLIG